MDTVSCYLFRNTRGTARCPERDTGHSPDGEGQSMRCSATARAAARRLDSTPSFRRMLAT
jgi:hypothetical protein